MTRTVMLISHTHWDRQWYRTVQEFKIALGHMMDSLLELLRDDPDFRVFHLDGQTAIIQDYLEIRPENKQLVTRMIQEGRLKIGPWFLQPDNFIVSGEGLIRNLLKGTRFARSMGGSTAVGWLPDSFGHNAQMPQILKNFGIDSFIFSRGLGDQLRNEESEFLWEAPNGDRVIAILQRGGYYGGGNLAYPFFWGNIFLVEPDHDLALKRLKELIYRSEKWAALETIPIWNGADHMSPERSLSETVRYVNSRLENHTLVHASIEDYIRTVASKKEVLQVVRGELRDARYEPVLPSVLSSRMHIKQNNYRIERSLERETEPLSVFSHIMGARYPKHELEDAWDGVLKNHFHDAICGCSIDQAHREMEYGFDKARQTAVELNRISLDHIASLICVTKQKTRKISVLIFNTIFQKRDDVAEICVDVPRWEKNRSAIFADDEPVPVQIVGKEKVHDLWIPSELSCGQIKRNLHLWQQNFNALEYRAIIEARIDTGKKQPELMLTLGNKALEPEGVINEVIRKIGEYTDDTVFQVRAFYIRLHLLVPVQLPPFGYTVATFQNRKKSSSPVSSAVVLSTSLNQWFIPTTAGNTFLENQHLRVTVNQNGTADIFQKKDGIHIQNANLFQDQADRGDTYDFCQIDSEDQENTILIPYSLSIKLKEKGPVRGSIKVDQIFKIPESLRKNNRNSRSPGNTILKVSCRISLSWDAPYAEFITTVENTAGDHRLRVYIPSPVQTGEVFSDGQFYIQSRNTVMEPKPEWASFPPETFPHDRWFAVSDGNQGAAVFSEGLPEHALVKSEKKDFLALTLLRCVGWLSRKDIKTRPDHGGPPILTPDAQCIGSHRFRYAVYPFSGSIHKSGIIQAAQRFDARPVTHQIPDTRSVCPERYSLFSLEPGFLQMDAIKKSENDSFTVVRFHNPGNDQIQARFSGDIVVSGVWRATADEKPVERLVLNSRKLDLAFTVSPCEIVTLLIREQKDTTLCVSG